MVSIPNLKQALALIVDNELPTALFRCDIQGKWIITTSFSDGIFNERTTSCHDMAQFGTLGSGHGVGQAYFF